MQIFYCDNCGTRFSDADVQNGKGVVIGKAAFCHKCAKTALGAVQTPPQAQANKKPSSKFRLKPVAANGAKNRGLGLILAVCALALVVAGLLLYFRTSSPTHAELPPPIKPVQKYEPVYSAPQVPPGKTNLTPPITTLPTGQTPSAGTVQPKTGTVQMPPVQPLPPQPEPDVSHTESQTPAAQSASPPLVSVAGAPPGALFYLGFEPDDRLVLHNMPLRYADGIPGRSAGVNEEGAKNYRLTIRLDNDKPVVELTPASVVVFGIKAEKQPVNVFAEVSEAKGTFYARCNWSDAVGMDWLLRGFRVGELVVGSSCKVRTIPDSFPVVRIDFRSADGPFYIDSLTVFPDGNVLTRLNEVAKWLKPAYPDVKISMGGGR